MSYVPNPTDYTQPVDTVFASTAAAEFRALKAYIQSIIGSPDITGNLYRRNLLTNGGFEHDQRNVMAAQIVSGAAGSTHYIADHWVLSLGSGVQQATCQDISGTPNQLSVVASVLDNTVGNNFCGIITAIEGHDLADLAWGTAGAKTVSLSFIAALQYQPGNLTFGIAVSNDGTGGYECYTTSVTAALTGTDTYFTIEIPGPTVGQWNTGNGVGAYIYIDMGSGNNLETNALNAWQNTGANPKTRKAGFASPLGNGAGPGGSVKLKQVQFEQSAAATPYEYLPFAVSQLLCERYFEKSFPQGVAPATALGVTGNSLFAIASRATSGQTAAALSVPFKVPKRVTNSTMTFYDPNAADANWYNATNAAVYTKTTVISDRSFTITAITPVGGVAAVGDLLHIDWAANADFW